MGVIDTVLFVLFFAILCAAVQAAGGFWNLLGIIGAIIGGIILLTIYIIMTKKILDKWKHEEIEEEEKTKAVIRDEKERNMAQTYLHNRIVDTILLCICDGNMSNRPYKIVVSQDYVYVSDSAGEILRRYGFGDHRIEPLKAVGYYEPNPVVAMAYAINCRLCNNYSCNIERDGNYCRATLTLTATRSF